MRAIIRRPLVTFFCLLVLLSSFALGIHNATLYAPNHGFDGKDHIFYLNYVFQHKQIPPPNLGKETHQSPLYYLIGSQFMSLTGNWKIVQYLNIFILWLIIFVVGLALWRVFKNKQQLLVGLFSLIALPMLNIFPAMITNELLSTLWIISAITSLIYLVSARTPRALQLSLVWFAISFILGMWTKVSIEAILPTVVVAFLITLSKNRERIKVLSALLFTICAIVAFSIPIITRGLEGKNKASNIVDMLNYHDERRPLIFYYQLDWIPKIDMYNAHYYSLTGGAWNSFWSDGQNAITPFVPFHKKAFILWMLGFVLLPLSLYGLWQLQKHYGRYGLLVNFYGASTIIVFVYFNTIGVHYSSARLTYVMGIVLPYAFGLAMAAKYPKIRVMLFTLLALQFAIMVSFFWIQPWWHVTK